MKGKDENYSSKIMEILTFKIIAPWRSIYWVSYADSESWASIEYVKYCNLIKNFIHFSTCVRMYKKKSIYTSNVQKHNSRYCFKLEFTLGLCISTFIGIEFILTMDGQYIHDTCHKYIMNTNIRKYSL